MMTCTISLGTFLFIALLGMAFLLVIKLKRNVSKIIIFLIFALIMTVASLVTSSNCLSHRHYTRGGFEPPTTFNNRELLKKTPTNFQMSQTEEDVFPKLQTIDNIKNNKSIDDKVTTTKLQEENILINEVEENLQPPMQIRKYNESNEGKSTVEHVAFKWEEEYLNSDNVIVKLRDYEKIASTYNSELRRQSNKMKLMKNNAIEAWNRRKNKAPFTPEEAEEHFGRYITWWELQEMKFYSKVWYLGLGAPKPPFSTNITDNFGFSARIKEKEHSKKRFYGLTAGDHIAFRFKILQILGRGTFGYVASVYDYKFNRKVAIKVYRAIPLKSGISQQDVKEVNMMMKITTEARRKDLFPIVYEYFVFRNHLCVVEELLGATLNHATAGAPVTDLNKLRQYTNDILSGVAELHNMKIAHMDLKTTNLAFTTDSEGQEHLKIMDFGHSCIEGNDYYECLEAADVQTPGYECPEVILELHYGTSCDLFTVGVILLRLATGRQQFDGENPKDSFALMMEIIGIPPPNMIEKSDQKKFFMDAICYVKENGFKRMPYRKPLKIITEDVNADLVDLISQLLRYEPAERMKASEAFQHPFLNP